jgi:hypothetical protein
LLGSRRYWAPIPYILEMLYDMIQELYISLRMSFVG